ncbi:MAG: signal peptide peptidase SppA [Pirellulales bacterium]
MEPTASGPPESRVYEAEAVAHTGATPPARKPRGIFRLFGILFVVGLLGMLGISLLANLSLFAQVERFSTGDAAIEEKLHSGKARADDKIAIISVEGAIMQGEGFVKRQIDRVMEDDAVKAVVLRVDSPGGTVTGSHYIYHHLNKLRDERDIPIVVSMGGLCASGGYYVSMACGDEPDAIFAEPTTWTGSIGVIIPQYNVSEFLDQWNIKDNSIASGPLKQMGSPTRLLDDEARQQEREVLQRIVNESFEGFKQVVASGRPQLEKNEEQMNEATTGQIFTARQALELGLVDKIGFIEEAIEQAAGKAGLKDEQYAVVKYEQPRGLIDVMLNGPSANASPSRQLDMAAMLDLTTPRAYYLFTWLPALAVNQ